MINWVDDDTPLPPTHLAMGADDEAPGLLAAGGRVTVRRLEEAYRHGVFPWFSLGQPTLWWSPNPRMVLPTAEFRISPSLKKTLRRFLRTPGCEIRIDSAFERVIGACSSTPRAGQRGTWILPGMISAYVQWHQAGRVHSVETWIDGELVGGLYGVGMGRMFFGESMFAHRTDASKIALAALVAMCRARGVPLIDCQQNTAHLATFGAREITREAFEAHLALTLSAPSVDKAVDEWTYDSGMWRHLNLALPPTDTHA